MATGPYLSLITLNVNGLNAPTKRQRLAELIQKQDPYICCLQETHFRPKDTNRLKGKHLTTKIIEPGKDLLQNRWRNQKLFRQTKVKRIQYHQTIFMEQMLNGLI